MKNPQMTASFEMKDTRGKKTFYLREFKPEQEAFAESIRHSKTGVLIRTEGVKGLPDYVYLRNTPSFVVIKYPKGFVIISGENLSFEKTKRKSLSWEQAQEIAHRVVK